MMSVFLTEDMDSAELVFFFCSAEDEKRSTTVAVLRVVVH